MLWTVYLYISPACGRVQPAYQQSVRTLSISTYHIDIWTIYFPSHYFLWIFLNSPFRGFWDMELQAIWSEVIILPQPIPIPCESNYARCLHAHTQPNSTGVLFETINSSRCWLYIRFTFNQMWELPSTCMSKYWQGKCQVFSNKCRDGSLGALVQFFTQQYIPHLWRILCLTRKPLALFLLRTYAICNKSKVVLFLLATFNIGIIVVKMVWLWNFTSPFNYSSELQIMLIMEQKYISAAPNVGCIVTFTETLSQ